jgi:uncharacterized membrane protein YphA (DoxX/SURF4 family)
MLSVFPEMLFLSPFAALIIRVALAGLFAHAAWKHARATGVASRTLALGETTVAIALFFGAWTQPAALLGAVVSAIWLAQKTARPLEISTIILALATSLSLLLTGPGAIAFDLPL